MNVYFFSCFSASQLLMPALQELVGGGTRQRVHEDREVARLRQSSLAAVAHAQCQHRADAVAVCCLQVGAPHVGVPWQILVRGASHRWRQTPPRTQLVPRTAH